MKTITYLTGILSLALVFGCGGQENASTPSDHSDSVSAEAHDHGHAQEQNPGLTLNDGMKWKTDNSTRSNVNGLKDVANAFQNQDNKSLDAYHSTGKQLSDSLSELINECRMQGPDHEALHLWLEPMLTMVQELEEAATLTAAETAFLKVHDQLELFDQYFE